MGNLTVGISDIGCTPLPTVANRAAVSGRLMDNITMTPVETVACDTILARRHPAWQLTQRSVAPVSRLTICRKL